MKRRQSGSAHMVIIILLTVALIAALSWIFYQNFLSDNTQTGQVAPATTEEAEKKRYIEVTNWGVRFELPSTIERVEYNYDDSKAVFDGDVIQITSIKTSTGEVYTSEAKDTDSDLAHKRICELVAIGRSKSDSVVNPTTGQVLQPVSALKGVSYYQVPFAGASCEKTPDAAEVTNTIFDAIKTPSELN